jgi:hypothetical protein
MNAGPVPVFPRFVSRTAALADLARISQKLGTSLDGMSLIPLG